MCTMINSWGSICWYIDIFVMKVATLWCHYAWVWEREAVLWKGGEQVPPVPAIYIDGSLVSWQLSLNFHAGSGITTHRVPSKYWSILSVPPFLLIDADHNIIADQYISYRKLMVSDTRPQQFLIIPLTVFILIEYKHNYELTFARFPGR